MDKNPGRVSFKTLGCKLNQAETASLATVFQGQGWQIVDFGDEAEVVVVNSCTVTAAAGKKSHRAFKQARRGARPPLVVYTGCHVDKLQGSLEEDSQTLVVGNAAKSLIPQYVDAHLKGEIFDTAAQGRTPFAYPVAERVFRTRGMIKIQDGCDNHCSFCIIPQVRGRGISRPLGEVTAAVQEAVRQGYREVVLTGVNMTRWEEGSLGFVDLARSCLEVEGDWRLRLGSLEPDRLGEGLPDLLDHPRMTPHIHLCVQSGSDKVLLKMRRQYTLGEFEEIVENLRARSPGFNVTTDLIVGFPGETDQDFEESAALARRVGFGHIHTFPYSRREGTRGDRMADQVPDKVKRERGEIIRGISQETKRAYRESLIGTRQEVLVEEAVPRGDGILEARGLGQHYVPLRFPLPDVRQAGEVKNQFFTLRVEALDSGEDPDLLGRVDSSR